MADTSPSTLSPSPHTDTPSPQTGPVSTKRSTVKKKKTRVEYNRYHRNVSMSDINNVFSLSTNRSKPVLLAFLRKYCKDIPRLMDNVNKLRKAELAQRVYDVREEWNREKDLGVPASLRLGKWRDEHGQEEDEVRWDDWLVSDDEEEEEGEENSELLDEDWESEADHELPPSEPEYSQNDDNIMLGEEFEETYPWWYSQPEIQRLEEEDIHHDPDYVPNSFKEQLDAYHASLPSGGALPQPYHADLFTSQLNDNEPLSAALDEALRTWHRPLLFDAMAAYRASSLAEKSQFHAAYTNLSISPSRRPNIIRPSILHEDVPPPPRINQGSITVRDALQAVYTQLAPQPPFRLRLTPYEMFHCHLSNYIRYKRNRAAPRPFRADADYVNEEARYREAKVFFAYRDPYELLRHYVNAILPIGRALDSKKVYAKTDEEMVGRDEMLMQYALLAEVVVVTLRDLVTWGEREDWVKECRYIVFVVD